MDFETVKTHNRLAMDTMLLKPAKGIPTGLVHIMQHSFIERIAGASPGDYVKDPDGIYYKMMHNIGVNIIDQYLAKNPLTMGDHGFENVERRAATGAEVVICDGLLIDSPEAVVEHLERFEFPRIKVRINDFDEKARIGEILETEYKMQEMIGEDILKTGYDYLSFPYFSYSRYGYVNYFMAFALYPEVMERHFSLQADYCLLNNMAAAKAYRLGKLAPLYRLDHDIADSRGTLADIKVLDRIWMPHLARCLEPILKTDIKLIWHCDGNLMQMVPRLLDIGIKGFQGFQYEDGMEYEKICKMKTKDSEDLVIWAGISVTRTLPFGRPSDVVKEMVYLVEHGPKTGLFLGTSSSLIPGAPWENVETMLEGFKYYREHGR